MRRISAVALAVLLHGAAGMCCLAQAAPNGAPVANPSAHEPRTLLHVANDLLDRTIHNRPRTLTAVRAQETRPDVVPAAHHASSAGYEWQWLPQGLLYHAYTAGEKESRISLTPLNDPDLGSIWEATLGGRVGIIRYGTPGAVNPEGWEVDLEGAALPRIDQDSPSAPLMSTDFRVGFQGTYRKNGTAVKAGYYHISSHLGDEFLLANPGYDRLNYVRDSLILGVTQDLTRNWQGYGEIGYALGLGGGSEPLEFQFGLQYDQRDRTNAQGAPFFAINGHLREEVNFGGGVNVLAGWRWRGAVSDHVLRIGLQYYNGKSLQYSFWQQSEQFVGGGIWFDY